jgi:hypothetical protein
MNTELWSQLLALVPTVTGAAVIVRMGVELAKKMGWVADNQATFWSLAGNAIAYAILLAARQVGLDSQVDVAFAYVNAHTTELVAVLSMLVLLAGSTGVTKLVHEGIKRLSEWWTSLGIGNEPDPMWIKAAEAIADSLKAPEDEVKG